MNYSKLLTIQQQYSSIQHEYSELVSSIRPYYSIDSPSEPCSSSSFHLYQPTITLKPMILQGQIIAHSTDTIPFHSSMKQTHSHSFLKHYQLHWTRINHTLFLFYSRLSSSMNKKNDCYSLFIIPTTTTTSYQISSSLLFPTSSSCFASITFDLFPSFSSITVYLFNQPSTFIYLCDYSFPKEDFIEPTTMNQYIHPTTISLFFKSSIFSSLASTIHQFIHNPIMNNECFLSTHSLMTVNSSLSSLQIHSLNDSFAYELLFSLLDQYSDSIIGIDTFSSHSSFFFLLYQLFDKYKELLQWIDSLFNSVFFFFTKQFYYRHPPKPLAIITFWVYYLNSILYSTNVSIIFIASPV